MNWDAINWEAIKAVCEVLGLLGAVVGIYMRLLFGSFESKLFRRLDSRYELTKLAQERHEETDRRLRTLEHRAGLG